MIGGLPKVSVVLLGDWRWIAIRRKSVPFIIHDRLSILFGVGSKTAFLEAGDGPNQINNSCQTLTLGLDRSNGYIVVFPKGCGREGGSQGELNGGKGNKGRHNAFQTQTEDSAERT